MLNEKQIEILLETEFLLNETTIKSHYTGSDFNYAKKLADAVNNIKTEKQKQSMIKKIEKALVEVDFFIHQFKVGDDYKTRYRKINAGMSNQYKVMLPISAILGPLLGSSGVIVSAMIPTISQSIRKSFMENKDKVAEAKKYEKELKTTLDKVKKLNFDK